MSEHDTYRERLLALDQTDRAREARYRARIAGLVNYELTPGGRWSFRAGLGLAIFGILFGALLAVAAPVDLPLRLVLVTYAAANVVMGVLLLRILRSGRFRIASDATAMATIAATGAFLVTVLFAIRSATHPGPGAAVWIAIGLLCVIVDVALLLWAKLTRVELRVSERLIKIEFQLAELTDLLARAPSTPDTDP